MCCSLRPPYPLQLPLVLAVVIIPHQPHSKSNGLISSSIFVFNVNLYRLSPHALDETLTVVLVLPGMGPATVWLLFFGSKKDEHAIHNTFWQNGGKCKLLVFLCLQEFYTVTAEITWTLPSFLKSLHGYRNETNAKKCHYIALPPRVVLVSVRLTCFTGRCKLQAQCCLKCTQSDDMLNRIWTLRRFGAFFFFFCFYLFFMELSVCP